MSVRTSVQFPAFDKESATEEYQEPTLMSFQIHSIIPTAESNSCLYVAITFNVAVSSQANREQLPDHIRNTAIKQNYSSHISQVFDNRNSPAAERLIPTPDGFTAMLYLLCKLTASLQHGGLRDSRDGDFSAGNQRQGFTDTLSTQSSFTADLPQQRSISSWAAPHHQQQLSDAGH